MSADFAGYQPNAKALRGLELVDFVSVMGPTAVGKSTLMDAATKQRPDKVSQTLTSTSRSLRPQERQDVDIHTRSEPEMLRRIAAGEYVQVAPRVFGAIYATAPEDYLPDRISLLPAIPDSLPGFLSLPFRSFRRVYLLPPSFEIWWQRITERQFDATQQQKRIAEARRSLEYAASHELEFIINDRLETATQEFMDILLGASATLPIKDGQKYASQLLSRLPIE
jgi:guanylate kinase